MAAILLSSEPPSLLLHLRPNPNPNPRLSVSFPLNHPLSISLPLKPSLKRHAVAVSATLVPSLPPPPPPMSLLQSTISCITAAVLSFLRSPIQSVSAAASQFFAQLPPYFPRRLKYVPILYLLIYEVMLLLRHSFPKLPWHREPLLSIAELCDPFLALSSRVIPPLFGSSDLSEALGIQLLYTLNLILIYALCP